MTQYVPRSGIYSDKTKPWNYGAGCDTIAVSIQEFLSKKLLKDVKSAGGLKNKLDFNGKIILVWIASDLTLRYLSSDNLQRGLEICDIVQPDIVTSPDVPQYWGRPMESELNRQIGIQQAVYMSRIVKRTKVIALLPGSYSADVKASALQLKGHNFSGVGVACGDWIRKDGLKGYYDRKAALSAVRAISPDKKLYAFGMSFRKEPLSLSFVDYFVNFGWYLCGKKEKIEHLQHNKRKNYLQKVESVLRSGKTQCRLLEENEAKKWVAVQ